MDVGWMWDGHEIEVRWTWAGHEMDVGWTWDGSVVREPGSRLTKQLLYGELGLDKRTVAGKTKPPSKTFSSILAAGRP